MASAVPAGEFGVNYEGLSWPTKEQQLLLMALFAPVDIALPSLRTWRAALNLDTMDSGSLSLMPLLYRRLRELGLDDPILSRLKGAHHFHWCKNQVRLRRALSGIDTLRAAGCEVVALKGLASLELYGDPGLRPMSDVDILVPRELGMRAVDALLGDGWRIQYGHSRAAVESSLTNRHGTGMLKEGAELDLHWCSLIEDLHSGGDEDLRRRARRVDFRGRTLLVPCSEDLLLHTCVHGARFSRAMSVTWVPDSVLLLERFWATLDWPLLVGEARRRVLELPLRETLRFLKEVLRCPVPDHVLDALRPREPAWLFWLDHYSYAADPKLSKSWHRAAARVAGRLRRGEGMPAGLVAPTPTMLRASEG